MRKRWIIEAITPPPSRVMAGPPTINGEQMQAALNHLSDRGIHVVSVFSVANGTVVCAAGYIEEEEDVIQKGLEHLKAQATEQMVPRSFGVDDYAGRDGEGKVVFRRTERRVADGWAGGTLGDIKAGDTFRFASRPDEVFVAIEDAEDAKHEGIHCCKVRKADDA